jgi:hypothetical protein
MSTRPNKKRKKSKDPKLLNKQELKAAIEQVVILTDFLTKDMKKYKAKVTEKKYLRACIALTFENLGKDGYDDINFNGENWACRMAWTKTADKREEHDQIMSWAKILAETRASNVTNETIAAMLYQDEHEKCVSVGKLIVQPEPKSNTGSFAELN